MKILPKLSLHKTIYYSLKYKGVIFVGKGTKVNIARKGRVLFKNRKSSLYLGVHFSTASGATLDIFENGRLVVAKSVGIHRGTKIVIKKNAQLNMGAESFINENSRVMCSKKITIGNNSSISWNVNISDTDSHGIYIEKKLINPNAEIHIGNKVWICANTTITKGTIIESNCIVGTNSLVVGKRLYSNNIYAGNPLKNIKKFDEWGEL
ncbi:acyltransferase [Pseudoalteromonas marina]|uniref:acyltransferase n=1 Tax=Pseudoalteromonas marina TaxID=267375 RepID=UPI002736E013|nr:acyltransferase [Pseudoalteromonas marina]MDP2485780.1 acyltransferase [Pseudoalteromonas marina]